MKINVLLSLTGPSLPICPARVKGITRPLHRVLNTVTGSLDLWDYRRAVSDIYHSVRAGGSGEQTWSDWKSRRDQLFATHTESPIENLDDFDALSYFPYDPTWRVSAAFSQYPNEPLGLTNSDVGVTPFRRIGRLDFNVKDRDMSLTALWLDSYGGGIFVPFRDFTNGDLTYGGGRYLLDSAKGADLGRENGQVVLDFNYSFHPSCVYSSRWSCPLAPPENRLEIAVAAGERLSGGHESP
jgi:uncharacterized protein (DUF1684 family)